MTTWQALSLHGRAHVKAIFTEIRTALPKEQAERNGSLATIIDWELSIDDYTFPVRKLGVHLDHLITTRIDES
jgi:hypothetical protein